MGTRSGDIDQSVIPFGSEEKHELDRNKQLTSKTKWTLG